MVELLFSLFFFARAAMFGINTGVEWVGALSTKRVIPNDLPHCIRITHNL